MLDLSFLFLEKQQAMLANLNLLTGPTQVAASWIWMQHCSGRTHSEIEPSQDLNHVSSSPGLNLKAQGLI